MYGTQGIQQQGRQVSFGQEDSGSQSQYGQGKRKPKDQAAKERDRLRKIEVRRLEREGIRQRATKEEPSWLSCAKCMVATGLSLSAAGRILRMHGTAVQRQFKARGIAFERRAAGDHGYITARRKEETRQKEAEESQFKAYKEAAMKEIRQHQSKSVYPCWSSIWDVEKARRKSAKAYEEMSPDKKKELYKRQWKGRKNNPHYLEKARLAKRKWVKNNPEKARSSIRSAIRKRKMVDPGYRAQCNLRNRFKEIMGAVRDPSKRWNSSLIGCDTRQLAKHLESHFSKGMTWENYGTHWHVDHIVPVSKFDHSIPAHVRQCWHWTNLAPLEADKNMAKGNKITKDTQLSLVL